VGDSRKDVSDEEYRDSTASEEEALLLPVEEGLSIDDYMNNYTNLLVDLVNVDVSIEEENKALILLNSLPDESMSPLS